MKYLLAFIFISFSFAPTKTNRQLFDDFHTIFAKADFKAMDTLLADRFVGLNESGGVGFKRAEYIEYMAGWNQAFKTKWNVVSIEEDGNFIKSVEYDTDIWNDYFYDGIKKTKYIYSFSNDKIATIQVDTVAGAAQIELAAGVRFRKFYKWVAFNFPEKMKVIDKQDKASAMETKMVFEKYLVANK
ncbi:MAG: nuclear transport factor 2 family protein [Ferruginibacter sp.]